jgi:hypothetical protein
MKNQSVCQIQGKSSLSKIKRKRGVETLSTDFTDSKTKIFEHLENFLSPGEQKSSRGGAITSVGSVAGKKLGSLDQRPGEKMRAQRRRTNPNHRI